MAEGMGAEGNWNGKEGRSSLLPPATQQEPSHISRQATQHPIRSFTLAEHRDIKRMMATENLMRDAGSSMIKVLWDNLQGWDRLGGRREMQEGTHVYTYDWLTLMYGRDKHNILQLKVNTILESQGKKNIYIYI